MFIDLQKLASIPPSAFYSKEHKHMGENFIRLCFIKVIKFCFNWCNIRVIYYKSDEFVDKAFVNMYLAYVH